MGTPNVWSGADDADRVTTITLEVAWRSDESSDPAVWAWHELIDAWPVRVISSETVEKEQD